MSDGYEVDPATLTADAADCWTPWEQDLAAIRDAVPTDIETAAFSFLPWFSAIGEQFVVTARELDGYLETGGAQLSGIAAKLDAIVTRYQQAETDVQAEITAEAERLDAL